jgi:subtilisin family serine protease
MLLKSETMDAAGIKNAMQKTRAGNIKNSYKLGDQLSVIELQDTGKNNLLKLQKQWNAKEDVIYSSPILLDETGKEIGGFTNQILVRLKSTDDYPLLTESIVTYNIQSIEISAFDNRTYILTLDRDTVKNTMQIAGELYETGLFEYAEPNLIHFIEPLTNDPYFPHQWGLNNTGQNIFFFSNDSISFYGIQGMDIRAVKAWEITTGSPNIKMAILDNGVDTLHPDLANNLLHGF